MNRSSILLLAFAYAFGSACLDLPASASLVAFADRAAFESHLLSSTTHTFEVADGFPKAPARLGLFPDGRVRIGGSGLYAEEGYLVGGMLEWPSQCVMGAEGQLSITFSEPPFAVGLDLIREGNGKAGVIFNFGNGAEPRQYIADNYEWRRIHPEDTYRNYTFLGVISNDPIVGIFVWLPTTADYGGAPRRAGAIDNLTLGIVPEPAAIGIAAVMSALVLTRRQNRNGTAPT